MDARAFLKEEIKKISKLDGSDLYIKAGEKFRYRLAQNVKILDDNKLTAAEVESLVNQITNDYHKKLLDEKGSVDFALDFEDAGRVRLNIFSQRGELCLVLRRVRNEIPSFEQLHIPPVLKSIAEQQRGLVLIGGATSSGKTTTIAAMIQHINNTLERHIVTIEDPIEYSFKDNKAMVNQREIGSDTNSFHDSLRYIVRQAPDVIIIGEMRDQETFTAALAAAETGRLLISTIHARNVVQVFERILGFFPAEQHLQIMNQLAFNLLAISVQRMLTQVDGVSIMPAFEVLTMSPAATKLARESRLGQLTQVMQQSGQDGMQTFNQALLKLYNSKKITQEEAFKASDNPQQLAMNMKGIFLDEAAGGILSAS